MNSNGDIDVPIYSIVKENEKPKKLTKKLIDDLLKHYQNFENGDVLTNTNPNNFRFVNISTAQRCGTWWHKYFFKFYSDLVAKHFIHIGLRLRNPFYCERLTTLFFVGHMPFPLQRLANINLVKNKFYEENFLRVKEINSGYFNNYSSMLQLIKILNKKVEGFKFNKFYYIYRNIYDLFISSFLMAKRSKVVDKNISLFQYTKNCLIEPFAFQFLSYQVAQLELKEDMVRIIRYEDILLNETDYFRKLLLDFGVPIYEDKLSEAILLSSKKFLGHFERITGLTINETIVEEQHIKHIANKEEKIDVRFTKIEKELIQNYLLEYGLKKEFFPEFDHIL